MKHSIYLIWMLCTVTSTTYSQIPDPVAFDSILKAASVLRKAMNYEDASKAVYCAMDLAEKQWGRTSVQYAKSAFQQGQILDDIGQKDATRSCYLEAVEILQTLNLRESADYTQYLNSLGLLLKNLGRYREAESWLSEGASIRERLFGLEDAGLGTLYDNLGNQLRRNGKYREAECYLLEGKRIRQNKLGSTHRLYIGSLNNLAILYDDIGKYSQAESIMLEILDFQKEKFTEKSEEYAGILQNLGTLYFHMNKMDKAFECARESYAIRKDLFGPDAPATLSSLNNLGVLYKVTGHFDIADSIYTFVLKTQKEMKDVNPEDSINTLNNLGTLYDDMGDLKRAEWYKSRVVELKRALYGERHPEYAEALNNLGGLQKAMGNYRAAEEYLLEALEIKKKALGKEHIAYIGGAHNLASLYRMLGLYELAERYYLEANFYASQVLGEEHPYYAASLVGLGLLYQARKDYLASEACTLEAAFVQEKNLESELINYGGTLNNLGDLYLDMGHLEKARNHYQKAGAIWMRAIGSENITYTFNLQGFSNLYKKYGDFELAEGCLLEAQDVLRDALGTGHSKEAGSFQDLGMLYSMMNRPDDAVKALTSASTIRRKLFLNRSTYLSEHEMFMSTVKFITADAECASFSLRHPDTALIESCLDNALFYKAYLLDGIRRLKNIALADPELGILYDSLARYQAGLAVLHAKPFNERYGLAELEEKANNLEKIMARRSAAFNESRREVGWRDVQGRLKSGEAAIEFVHFPDNSPDSVLYVALLILPEEKSPKQIFLFEEKRLRALLAERTGSMALTINRHYRQKDPSGKYTLLYTLIWRPLRKYLKGIHTIYYSPSGYLHRINFDAIQAPNKKQLSDEYHLVRINSTRQLVSPPVVSSTMRTALLLGGIDYDSTAKNTEVSSFQLASSGRGVAFLALPDSLFKPWKALTNAGQEVDQIARTLETSGYQTVILKGKDASETIFKKIGVDTPSPTILHIATHGYFFPNALTTRKGHQEIPFQSSDNPLIRSGLILAGGNKGWMHYRMAPDQEDGVLTAYEISQMNLSSTELVVLSACETGLGTIANGYEGVLGLQRAFRIAGARHLLMSLWQVPDAQTKELMTAFYTNWLEKGMAIHDSLLAAQNQVRIKNPNPYYWAGFVLLE